MCNKDFDSAGRQSWRETDGFAKTHDTVREDLLHGTVGKAGDFREKSDGQPLMSAVHRLNPDSLETIEINIRSPSYTPLLVQMMIELYTLPVKRAWYCNPRDSKPPAQVEVIGLLVRAGIMINDWQNGLLYYNVDEEALRVYVDRLCCIPLPRKVWEI